MPAAAGGRGGIFSADSFYGFYHVSRRAKEAEETMKLMAEATEEFLLQVEQQSTVQQLVAGKVGEYSKKIVELLDPVLKFIEETKDDEKKKELKAIIQGYSALLLKNRERLSGALLAQAEIQASKTVISSLAFSNLPNPFSDSHQDSTKDLQGHHSSEYIEIEGLKSSGEAFEGGLDLLKDLKKNGELLEQNIVAWMKNEKDRFLRHISFLAIERKLTYGSKDKIQKLVERIEREAQNYEQEAGKSRGEIAEMVEEMAKSAKESD